MTHPAHAHTLRRQQCFSCQRASFSTSVVLHHKIHSKRSQLRWECTPYNEAEQHLPAAAAHVLNSMRVVLVAPKTPANIGAVARACANFETTDLWLVAPRCDPHDGEVAKVAIGEEVLKRMQVADDLQMALNDTIGSVGFTRRAGATRYTHGSVTDMLQKFPSAIAGLDPALYATGLQPGKTALVFGREESGLTEEELRLCSHSCAIPTGRIQSSMNLSHAVAVVLSGLFERRLELMGLSDLGLDVSGSSEGREGLQPAAASELAALLTKVSDIARRVGMSGDDSRGGGAQGSHGRRRLPVGHIRAVLARAQANTWEVRSLHGLASAILNRVSDGAASTSTDGTVISSFTTGSGDLEQQQPSPAVSD